MARAKKPAKTTSATENATKDIETKQEPKPQQKEVVEEEPAIEDPRDSDDESGSDDDSDSDGYLEDEFDIPENTVLDGNDDEESSDDDDEQDKEARQEHDVFRSINFSKALSAILDTKLNEQDSKYPILCRFRSTTNKLAAIEEETTRQKEQKMIRKQILEKSHGLPDIFTLKFERELMKTARRGVVKLLNAVSAVKKVAKEKELEESNVKAVETAAKSKFLEVLKQSEESKQQASGSSRLLGSALKQLMQKKQEQEQQKQASTSDNDEDDESDLGDEDGSDAEANGAPEDSEVAGTSGDDDASDASDDESGNEEDMDDTDKKQQKKATEKKRKPLRQSARGALIEKKQRKPRHNYEKQKRKRKMKSKSQKANKKQRTQ